MEGLSVCFLSVWANGCILKDFVQDRELVGPSSAQLVSKKHGEMGFGCCSSYLHQLDAR